MAAVGWVAVGLVVLLQLTNGGNAFYLPGVSPIDYPDNALVDLKVNKLTSVRTQLPFDYYSVPFCRPEDDKIHQQVENLGEVLRGDRIENSPYELYMKQVEKCKVLCQSELDPKQTKIFTQKIHEEYRVHFLLDNLPGAMVHYTQDSQGKPLKMYELGYPIGLRQDKPIDPSAPPKKPKTAAEEAVAEDVNTLAQHQKESQYFLNNHVVLTVLYHQMEDPLTPGSRIVGFEVEPRSINHPLTSPPKCGVDEPPLLLSETGTTKVRWTYDVVWREDPIRWASRWDAYLYMSDDRIHWFGIFNSAIIVIFLTGLIAFITLRALRQDLSRYNAMADAEDIQEEFGWKLVHGDVFRPPPYPMLLAVSVGSGVQVLGMSLVTMIFAVFGLLSPANRGALLSAVVVMFVLMGILAGYFAARIYKMLAGMAWKRLTALTALLYPGVIFGIFFFVNFFIWGERSSGAVPFTTLVALLAMWFCISLPLVCLGAYFGFKQKIIEAPVRTNQIPRQVPVQVWYLQPTTTVLFGGVIPFGAIFIELFFILSSIWLHSLYYIFGILFLVFLILILTCGEIAIVLCYFQLCAEDYQWWWRAFLTPGSSGLYVFLYSCFYYFTRLEIHDFVPTLLYFSYSAIFTIIFFLLTGTVGFYSCLVFVRTIYASIKVD